MRAITAFGSVALFIASLAPETLADGRNPGSMLVYPVHRSGTDWFTILSVTNTNTTPATPNSFGGSVNVHFEYVNVTPNPANPFRPLDCVIFDRVEFLTPADTLSVLTTCHNAFGGAGQEGYVVVTAEDPYVFRDTVQHDYLVGSAIVLNARGVMYSVNALPFGALSANPDTDDGVYELGIDYEAGPDTLIIDSFIALAGSGLALINVDEGFHAINDVYLSVWNDNERALSATLRFNCWFDQPLTTVSPLFAESFLQSVPNDPAELDINCDGIGDLETGWATIDSRGVTRSGGEKVNRDGLMLGSITTGATSTINGGRLLWESDETQEGALFEN